MSTQDHLFQQLLTALEERAPTVPDELVEYYCGTSGNELEDPRAVRLLGLATQKFITEILKEAIHLSRGRDRLPFSRLKDLGFNPKDKTRVLLLEELIRALKQLGIQAHHAPYFMKALDGHPS